MNQKQREYLISQVKERYKIMRKELEDQKKQIPSMEKYIVRAIIRGDAEIISTEEIMEILEARVDDPDFSKLLGSESRRYWETEPETEKISFGAQDFFKLPDSFVKVRNEILSHNSEIGAKINHINSQEKQLILRLNLASSKMLDTMIGEVDSMGEMSLFENAVKLLEEPKTE